ncbi:MAG: glycosyltransferase family 4 protein [Candidatus Moranbacteria bacterium]|nr:glycosyltransferase family 4 protein [Candidatus Moranbacteria bacterium]
MRIAFMSREKTGTSGRSEMPFERLSSELASFGHDVTVYDVANDRRNDPAAVTGRVRMMTFFRARSVFLRSLLSSLHVVVSGYDILHADSCVWIPYLFLFRVLRRRSCVIVTLRRDIDLRGLRMSFITRIVDMVVYSDRDMFERMAGSRRYPSVHIPYGVDEISVKSTTFIRSFGLKESRFALSSTHGAGHEDIRCLVKVFQYLEDTGKLPNNFRLAIMGDRAETAGYGRYLRTMNEEHGNILFLGDCSDRDRDELMSHAALFVQPSAGAISSGEILAAMSAGLPIVAADGNTNQEILGSSGTYFSVGDIDSLRTVLAYMLNRPDEMRTHGELSLIRIRNRYSWEHTARLMSEMYGDVLRARYSKVYGIQRNNHHA